MNDVVEYAEMPDPNKAAMHSVMVMEQWGNGETYNEDRWIERGRQAAQKTLEGMFELGRALIVLKEHNDRGRFMDLVQSEFGLHQREAQRMMNATYRFASPQMQKAAPKLMNLGKSKLLELLVEEDDTLTELVDGGELNGHTLDDVDRMTIKELLRLTQGSVVALDGLAGEPLDILINGYLIAQGEVVVVADKYGVRITDIITPSERMRRLSR